jgi:hypothetical protein
MKCYAISGGPYIAALVERDLQLEQLEDLKKTILEEKAQNMREGAVLRSEAGAYTRPLLSST